MTVIPMNRPRRRPEPTPVTEAQLQNRWIKACQELGNLAYFHVFNGMFCQFGFPDLVLIGPGGVWFVELKIPGGMLSPQQEHWRRAILGAKYGNYACHTPAHWDSGESLKLLHSIAGNAQVIRFPKAA